MAEIPSLLPLRSLIARSGLLSANSLEPYFEGGGTESAPPTDTALAERLVSDGLLTPYQARQLLRGQFDEFFINDKYKILGLIGAGGMGKVYLCEHLQLNRLVAIKMLQVGEGPAFASAVERFYREGRAVAALDHPNIVRVFDIDRLGKRPFMVLEYVDGANLHDVVARTGSLSVERACYYIRQTAAGLAQAHAVGLIHRDIKPGNILLDRVGAVKLLDLGLAKFSTNSQRNDPITDRLDRDMVIGTADFMAPEQADAKVPVDARSDIYSLGCTFYFLLTGRVPFPEGTAFQKLYQHQNRAPEPLSELCPRLPADLGELINRMIDKSPEDRLQSAREVIEGLAPWSHGVIKPPADTEMPATPASYYRLGLSPRDETSGQFVTPRPLASMETERHSLARPGSDGRLDASPDDFSLSPGGGSPSAGTKVPPPHRQTAPLPYLVTIIALFLAVGLIGKVTRERQLRLLAEAGGEVVAPPGDEPGSSAVAPGANRGVINGGGSTFIQPVMSRWINAYDKTAGIRVEYQPVGSGKGIASMSDGGFLFAATDAPLDDAQLEASEATGHTILHIPLVMGAVVPAYNLPDIPEAIAFTAPILADIYLGKITRWNDPAIRANNPGMKFPDLEIGVVRRSDASGTTHIWTDYLSKVSAEWKKRCGTGTEVAFPVGVGVRGNNGVTTHISRNIGSLGYVELTYAMQNNLKYGKVKNRDGHFVNPSLESVTAACSATMKSFPEDLRYSLTDASGEGSYPIAGTTWAVLCQDQTANPAGRELVEFLRWATHEGQANARELKYAPLPPELVKLIDSRLSQIKLAPGKSK